MKLATSLVALTKLGPDYRYRTNVLADGVIDASSRTLDGDLVVEGGADPLRNPAASEIDASPLRARAVQHHDRTVSERYVALLAPCPQTGAADDATLQDDGLSRRPMRYVQTRDYLEARADNAVHLRHR